MSRGAEAVPQLQGFLEEVHDLRGCAITELRKYVVYIISDHVIVNDGKKRKKGVGWGGVGRTKS